MKHNIECPQFEEWLIRDYDHHFNYFEGTSGIRLSREDRNSFYNLPFSMQQGVYLEFFRSVDIWIEIVSETPQSHFIKFLGPDIMSPFFKHCEDVYYEGTIEEAFIFGKDKAFEILEQ